MNDYLNERLMPLRCVTSSGRLSSTERITVNAAANWSLPLCNAPALVVELLVASLIGVDLGFEASSLFVDAGNRSHLGQPCVVSDPGELAGRVPRDLLVAAQANGIEAGEVTMKSLRTGACRPARITSA